MADKNDSFYKLPILFKILRGYLKFWQEKVYYRKFYEVGKENVPPPGTPIVAVSNHQYSLIDATSVITSITDRKISFLARGDAFKINKFLAKFMNFIGILPAYRMAFDGASAVKNNYSTFEKAENRILEGNMVALFPEGRHQEGHWLGNFGPGYLRLAFEAAEKSNFEKEIFIQPLCNHYSRYHGLRNDKMIKFGQPISLKPYYEEYKTNPHEVKRKVNALVSQVVEDMMLNVKDQANYRTIEFIRNNVYGDEYAVRNSYDPKELPQKLESDKKLVAALDGHQEIYDKASQINKMEKVVNVADRVFENPPKKRIVTLKTLGMILLLPIAILCLWPSVFCWFLPKWFADRARGRMFQGTFLVAFNLLLILPLTAILSLLFFGFVFKNWWLGVIYVLIIPLIVVFEWLYTRWLMKLIDQYTYLLGDKLGKIAKIHKLRDELKIDISKL